ncbi:Bifunctional transcriptional activator/DNA repair enzyme Ada OS=Escherichia coli (strain K12) GN=ada PE=1 SV=2 [Rhizoctonia solani AG-1 IB]|uniref:Bifunctional transcriptional activator/DNA repair enzyme Ada n=1 Tax=Thanatephorus cucumeris (strain AG1-IB / isolate 7/3/14) TaxID=1108050 RepID=A0A0B7FFK6_THACB|nr:Bifunctional transcriptional activator/DNA repair enzyme Ada OS=Escherichia coli (strain K12) GN=ada PE=1 SV=2 [Rhizoctonia solani AG-1 IB]
MLIMPIINADDANYVPDIWFTNQADNTWDDLANFLNTDPLATLPSEETGAPSWMEDFQFEQFMEPQLMSTLEQDQTPITIRVPASEPEPSPSLSPASAPLRTPSPIPAPGPASDADRYDSADARWQAVLDRAQTSSFVHAVVSTKIYCRPSCPSRRPNRQNVVFYDTNEQATEAGFRPCKRCRPDDAAGEAAEQRQAAAVERAKFLIEERSKHGQRIPLDKLASQSGLSTFYFHRVFKRRTGFTPEEWGKLCRERLANAKK